MSGNSEASLGVSPDRVFLPEDDKPDEEELERFDDFTIASSWERFISEIEGICRQWVASDKKNLLDSGEVQTKISPKLYKVKCDLNYAAKSYIIEYYFVHDGADKVENWNPLWHYLQLCFGVKDFLVIAPQSASGVVLDAPEASKLLSAVAIALTNSCSIWPAFVPVHDPSRKAYIGIQNMDTVYTRRFESDHISNQVPVKFMHLEGLYDLFVSKFAYSSSEVNLYVPKVHFTMKSTYRTIRNNEDYDYLISDAEIDESGENTSDVNLNRTQWDDNCPWSEWYSSEDPIKGLDLFAIWSEKIIENSLEMAVLENSPPNEAEQWSILPILSATFLEEERTCFASQLQLLINTLEMSFKAQFLEDFVSVENPTPDNVKSSMVKPSPAVVDRVLKDIFRGDMPLHDDHKNSRAIKGAPLGSLFARFCLHCLWIGNCNIRAIAVLWIEFIREVRWCWEESQPLPKMPTNHPIDLTTCLINQKLQMMAICIERKCEMNEEFQDCIGSSDDSQPKFCRVSHFQNKSQLIDNLEESESEKSKSDNSDSDEVPISQTSNSTRRGSKGEFGSMKLLKSNQIMHDPYTQDAPLMTEDMHEERFQAAEKSDDSFSFSGQLEKDILLSDMSAFKAANPDAVFEDFIRWHSPRDWESNEKLETENGEHSDWPPHGRLSQRMTDHGNMWRKLWNEAPALSAFQQKPLLDSITEGEKVLHYLETLRPCDLLQQMVSTAFKASADTLLHTIFGGLDHMKLKLDQLYATMASSLKPLQGCFHINDNQTIQDLQRLCVVFRHVENLLAVATSLHLKFHHSPRLANEFFSEFHNSYLPRMGNGNGVVTPHQIQFEKERQVGMPERQSIRNLFTPPSASQSWRKVLSMGNLLNGHEPVVREIKFSVFETFTNIYHSAQSNRPLPETYRMYVRGTSNDLRVALSVASSD